MGRTYTVPRSAKGESRFLYIFTMKSLISTIVGAVCGVPFYFIFSILNMKVVGFIFIGLMGVIGYFIAILTIPDSPIFGNLRKAGGEKLSDILIRTITFTKRKKIYIYKPNLNKNTYSNHEKNLNYDTDNSDDVNNQSEEEKTISSSENQAIDSVESEEI